MSHLPAPGLATSDRWNSKPQLEPLGDEADAENNGQASAKGHKDTSSLDKIDPVDQQPLLWSWPQDIQYQNCSFLGTSPKATSHLTPPAPKAKDHPFQAATKISLHGNSAATKASHSRPHSTTPANRTTKLPFSFRAGSPASPKRRASSLLPDLEDSLSQTDDCEDMDVDPERRPLSMPFLGVNRDCAAGDFKHYCPDGADDKDADPYFGMPLYSPRYNDTTPTAFGSGDGLGAKVFWGLV